MTTLYTFDRSKKVWPLIGIVEQQRDPISGELIHLRNATDKEVLPKKDGYVRGFATGNWEYYVDNIGTEYWGEDGKKYTITEPGEEVPVGAFLEEPEKELTDDELAEAARTKRDSLLSNLSWRYERYASEMRLGVETTDSIEKLDIYAQALRDITDQEGFPLAIEWPELQV